MEFGGLLLCFLVEWNFIWTRLFQMKLNFTGRTLKFHLDFSNEGGIYANTHFASFYDFLFYF